MYNKIFRTLDKYPKIYLGFLISTIVMTLFTFLGRCIAEEKLMEFAGIWVFDNTFLISSFSLLFSGIGSILLSVFLYPLLLMYVKKACLKMTSSEGTTSYFKDEVDRAFPIKADNYKSILKSCWYRIILVNAVAITVVLVLSFFSFWIAKNVIANTNLIIIMYFMIVVVFSLYTQIASVCVIVEDSFRQGLKGIRKYGKKIVFSLLGVIFIISIPLFIIGFLENSMFGNVINLYSFFSGEVTTFSVGMKILAGVIIFIAYLYGIYEQSFMYTFITQKYIDEKCESARVDDCGIVFEGETTN